MRHSTALEFHAAMHNISGLGIRRLLEGHLRGDLICTSRVIAAALADSSVRTLSQQEELPLLRDHLLRLDRASRHDRFHGFMDDSFIERYAEKCAERRHRSSSPIFEDGVVRGAAELHPPEQSPDSLPEIAFSVEASVRRRGVGSILFRKLIAEARAKGYAEPADHHRRAERSDAGARQQVRRASDVPPRRIHRHHRSEPSKVRRNLHSARSRAASTAARAIANFNRAYWRMLLRMSGWGRAA